MQLVQNSKSKKENRCRQVKYYLGVEKELGEGNLKKAEERASEMSSKESCRSELRIAIRQLSDRCLYSATKWQLKLPNPNPNPNPNPSPLIEYLISLSLNFRASEQLVGIEQDPSKFTPSYTRFQRGSSSIRRKFRTHEVTATPPAGVSYVVTPVMEEDALVDTDFYLLAKSYFDCREYKRAAHVLRDQIGRKSLFLRCYALYLVCSFSLLCL